MKILSTIKQWWSNKSIEKDEEYAMNIPTLPVYMPSKPVYTPSNPYNYSTTNTTTTILTTYWDDFLKQLEKEKQLINEKFNAYSVECQNLTEELLPLITPSVLYPFPYKSDDTKLNIAEIVEKHLKNIKFNHKLTNILEE